MATEIVVNAVEVDLRGQICPATLLKALQEINRHKEALRAGTTILVVLTDHRDATVTIPDAASSMGYGVAVKKDGPHYRVVIGRHGAAEGPGGPP